MAGPISEPPFYSSRSEDLTLSEETPPADRAGAGNPNGRAARGAATPAGDITALIGTSPVPTDLEALEALWSQLEASRSAHDGGPDFCRIEAFPHLCAAVLELASVELYRRLVAGHAAAHRSIPAPRRVP